MLVTSYERGHPLREELVDGLVSKLSRKEIKHLECLFEWSARLGGL